MSSSLIDIRKRIDSTLKTKQITSAMQMVSASKLHKSEQHVKQFQVYSKKIHDIVAHLASSLRDSGQELEDEVETTEQFVDYHDMLIERPIKKTGYLIISSDEGLAGNYNSSIFHSTLKMLQEDHDNPEEVVLLIIGASAKLFFEKAGYHVCYQIDSLSDHPSFEDVRSIIVKAVSSFKQGEFDALYVCYNHHVNAMVSVYRAEQMLPLTDLSDVADNVEHKIEYVFEPSREAVLSSLLPQYAESLIYGAIIDAKTAEHASRMIAMRNATDNADKLVSELNTEYNQRRQTAITQEITEIVGGAAALQ